MKLLSCKGLKHHKIGCVFGKTLNASDCQLPVLVGWLVGWLIFMAYQYLLVI